jgi:redox-sensitive bicupin YhaK (pirin superfamily)
MSIVATEEPFCLGAESGEAVEWVLQAKPRDLGGFTVGRLLPAIQRRFVGPFVFLDVMGPVAMAAGTGMDVRPHPHIGLSTVTYLFAGQNMHRDSLGSVQLVKAGDLNIMTAGRGVVHSERTDPDQRARGGPLHGVQIWLGLPENQEDGEPTFSHHPQSSLPVVAPSAGALGRVLLGAAFGARSPVVHPSQPLLLDLQLETAACLELPNDGLDRGVLVIEGSIRIGDRELERDHLAVLRRGLPARALAREPTRFLLFGGTPLGHRFLDWNFVSSSQAKIDRARQAWKDQTFPKIPGDDQEFVPLPEWPHRARPKGESL